MPHLSLTLTLALAAGLAGGVLVDVPLTLVASLVLAGGWLTATLGFTRAWPRVPLAGVTTALVAAGWLFGAHAVERAMHSPLRTLLEQRIGGFALESAHARESPRSPRGDEPIVIEGRLLADAAATETGAAVRIAVERVWVGPCPEPASGGVSLGVTGAMQRDALGEWTAGRRVRAPVLLRRPARYLNHGVPDQERALARRGITLVGSIKSAALVDVVERGRWWEELAAAVRARTRRALARHVQPLGDQSGAIATAILIGDRAGLDVEIERRLQEAGTYHVIAISGGNIAIFASLVLLTLSWLGVRGRIAAVVTIAVLAAYAAIAAGGASVARATLMAAVYLAVRLIDQRTAALNAIGLCGGVLLLANPLSIVDVGFWLTFGASAAIVVGVSAGSLAPPTCPPKLVTEPSERRWKDALVPPKLAAKQMSEGGKGSKGSRARARVRDLVHRAGRIAFVVLIASICAELALAPVAALVFQRVTLAGLLLNFVALPAMTVVQLGAMLVVALDLIGLEGLARLAGTGVHAGTGVLINSARLLDYSPWLTWRVPSPSMAVIVAYYTTLIAAVLGYVAGWSPWKRPRLRLAAAVAAAVLFTWVIVSPPARVRALGDGRLHLTMIDVGQGDAMLVTFPNGRTLAIDTGGVSVRGDFDVGDRVIGPALRARNLLRLDHIAVTHGDPDHIGGARALVRDFAPADIWWGVPVADHEPTALLQQEAVRTRATWRTLQRGDRIEIGGVEMRVHHPPLPDWERQKVRNDDSLVLELRFGDVSMLLTGDIGRAIETELLPALELLPTVILKVPHHGSGTSSSVEFVERVKPRVALIGVGRGNSYGHPLPYVLERYQRVGSEVFRTDQDGQVTVTTDGRDLQVSTYTGRRLARD